MNNIICWLLFLVVLNVQAKLHSTKIDSKELKCLVCRTTIKEFNKEIAKIDPTHKVDVGGYRIDAKGNLQQKKVSKAKSEIYLSELASSICNTMDDYIRGTWKDDGKLTVFKLIENGQMSTKFGLVDIIQDDDLNKSLKYHCEEVVGENEDHIIKQYLDDVENIAEAICIDHAGYCTADDFIETEHVAPPGSEDDFGSQFGMGQNFNFDGTDEKTDATLDDEDIIDNDGVTEEDVVTKEDDVVTKDDITENADVKVEL